MTNEKKSNDLRTTNWEYLPDSRTLLQYLNRSDIIELSKSCKRHRSKLELIVFKNLTFSTRKNSFSNREYYFISSDLESYLISVLNFLEEDLKQKSQLIREVTFNITFSVAFAEKFCKLFPNIEKLKYNIWVNKEIALGLQTLINGLEYLDYIKIWFFENEDPQSCINTLILPKPLKFIKARVFENEDSNFSIFDCIDANYSNLVSLSITSKKVLDNLTITMPNLLELIVLNNHELETLKLVNFIKQNPQLRKLKTCLNNSDSLLLESILNLKSLRYWSIDKYNIKSFKTYNFSTNNSIKTLKLGRHIGDKNVIELIYACKSLEFIEFKEWEFSNDKEMNWAKLTRRVNTIKFYMCDFYDSTIQCLDSLRIFNQAIFIIEYIAEDTINQLSSDKLINYKLLPIVIKDEKFSTIKKAIKLIKP